MLLQRVGLILSLGVVYSISMSQPMEKSSIVNSSGLLDKTIFQTSYPWREDLDSRTDGVAVYGINDSLVSRISSWSERGYDVQLMTGISWGDYRDYLDGMDDGTTHWDEGQADRSGNPIMHGSGIPYMVPTQGFINYFKKKTEKAIDAGVSVIHLEEPEFWSHAGYSEAFKKEWQAYYHEPWTPPHQSPDAAYHSAKLKYYLYQRALQSVFKHIKEYSQSRGKDVQCFVPTHSLLNYSAWGIVSPESALASIPEMDGYIAQVWTGTSRTPTTYQGTTKERTFENAFLEYGSAVAMTRPSGKKVYFLTDPVEDNPNHTWADYKANYEKTFTAQLFYPVIADYEVMPWPERIFLGKFKTLDSQGYESIPAEYATEIMVLINALQNISVSADKISGPQGIGVLISDSLMFQRYPDFDSPDARLSGFYGLALPLLIHGVPVQCVQMENLPYPETLKDIRVLLMSYSNMKPLQKEYHDQLAQWVKQGGTLIYLGKDDDPYQQIHEWWNTAPLRYDKPSVHLFQLLGYTNIISGDGAFDWRYGKGHVFVYRKNPLDIAEDNSGQRLILQLVEKGLRLKGEKIFPLSNYLLVKRGPYDILAVLEEGPDNKPYSMKGIKIDLFNPELPVVQNKTVKPGEQSVCLDLSRWTTPPPCILATASRAYDEKIALQSYSFIVRGPLNTKGIARVLLNQKPKRVVMLDALKRPVFYSHDWDEPSHTVRLKYTNSPDGIWVRIDD